LRQKLDTQKSLLLPEWLGLCFQIRAICQEHEEGQVPGRISTAHSHLWVQKYALKKKNQESYSSFEMKWNSDDRLVFLPLEDCNIEQNFYYFLAI